MLLLAVRASKYYKVGLYGFLQQVHDCPILDVFLVSNIIIFKYKAYCWNQ